MPYDDALADRVRHALMPYGGADEREMLGGLMFYQSGTMRLGVVQDQLLLRMSPDAAAEALSRNGADPSAEEQMPGIITVSPVGHELDEDLNDWIELAMRAP
jgi:TfoX/Sxy family transcriptional regulator of competence genes